MPALIYFRRVAAGTAVVALVGLAAACGATSSWPTRVPISPSALVEPTLTPTPTPTPIPTPTPTPTPMSTLDSFKAKIASIDFQAQGSMVGSITATTIFGSSTGSVTGTFEVKGGDSADSITAKILGVTDTSDNIVVGDRVYSRTNGGQWTKAPASGKTLQGFVGSGIVLTDAGLETKFGRWLHRLTVTNTAGVDLSTFGIAAGPSLENLTVSSLSFWAEDDGTPAGLTIGASLDQKIFGLSSHETVTLDISIDTLSGVTITAPPS